MQLIEKIIAFILGTAAATLITLAIFLPSLLYYAVQALKHYISQG